MLPRGTSLRHAAVTAQLLLAAAVGLVMGRGAERGGQVSSAAVSNHIDRRGNLAGGRMT